MKKVSVCLLALLLLVACKQDKNDHLPADKMEKVLIDIQLAEVYSTMAGKDSVHTELKNNDSLAVFYREVLDHHGLTLEQFEKSLDWYREHPDKLDTVFVRSINTLGKQEQQLQKK